MCFHFVGLAYVSVLYSSSFYLIKYDFQHGKLNECWLFFVIKEGLTFKVDLIQT